jgi:GNAT superfamily N-acetyltransferase
MATIRPALANDARDIARVHVESWRTTYKGIVPQSYLEKLEVNARATRWEELLRGGSTTLVAEDAGSLCGFINGGPLRELLGEHDCEIFAIYILAGAQRHGIGKDLMHALAETLARGGYQRPLVWVLAENPSRDFYARLGGRRVADKLIDIGGAELVEVAYGWESMDDLLRRASR